MGERTGSEEVFATTANDRLRERWEGWVRRAVVLSFLAHGLLFAVSPQWRRFVQDEVGRFRGATQLITIPSLDAAPESGGDIVNAVPAAEETPGEEEAAAAVEGEGGRSGMGIQDLIDLYADLIPSSPYALSTPVVISEDEYVGPDRGRGISSPDLEAVSANRLAELREMQLDLERLAALRPELALTVAYPDWPLLRNPTTVVRYIRNEYERIRTVAPIGSVSVAMWIDERGTVGWAEVYESSGEPAIDNLALSVFNEVVEFRPARRQGAAVPMSVVIWLHFPF